MPRIAIVGSRDWPWPEAISQYVKDHMDERDILVSGGAAGVDTYAQKAAEELGIKVKIFLPSYEVYKKWAPIMRNREIVEYAQRVVVFWYNNSPGSKSVINMTRHAGKKLLIYKVMVTEYTTVGYNRWK